MVDKKVGNVNKSILDVHVIDVYFTSTPSSTWVLDTGSVANIGNSKQKLWNKRSLAKGEVMMCVGNVSKDDMIKRRTLPLPSGLVLNLNNCYLVLAIGSCLLQYDYSFKENNGYSIFLNNHLQWFIESRS